MTMTPSGKHNVLFFSVRPPTAAESVLMLMIVCPLLCRTPASTYLNKAPSTPLDRGSNKSTATLSPHCVAFFKDPGKCAGLDGSLSLAHTEHLWFRASAMAVSDPPVKRIARARAVFEG